MFIKQQIFSCINKSMSLPLILILLYCVPVFSQVLTGTYGIRVGISHDAFTNQEGEKWTGSGEYIGFELGVNLIRSLEFVTGVSFLKTRYSYTNDEVIYYKDSREYKNLYIPFRLRFNFRTFEFLQPNIKLGSTITKQYSGHRQIEYHMRHPIPDDSLETEFSLLFALGAKFHLMSYLSIIPGIHYQRNLAESNSHDILFSPGMSFG